MRISAILIRSGVLLLLLLLPRVAPAQSITDVQISPRATAAGLGATVTVTAQIADPTLIGASVNLQQIDALGRATVLGNLHDDGQSGDAIAGDKIYTLQFSVYQQTPGPLTYRVSAAFLGKLLRVFSSPLTFNVTGTVATGVTISQPANLVFLNSSPIIVSGTVGDPGATVTVSGIKAIGSGQTFQTTVPLQEGTNTITAVAANTNGTTSTASVQVTLDTTPPRVTIGSPPDGFHTTESSITVTGIVNDIVVGTVNSEQAKVTVNGVTAQVANRTYTAANIPLSIGPNSIQVIGRDQVGNGATVNAQVTRDAITQPYIKMISGNNQTGPVGTQLNTPLIVQLLNGSTPVTNQTVILKVTENDGTLQPGVGIHQLIAVRTDPQGQALAYWTLGNRAGVGNNIVQAYAAGFQGVVVFTASGTPSQAAKINVDSGNNQFGAVSQALALPLVAIVTDAGHNRLNGVPVTFTVKQGGGKINGATSLQTTTDGDGRALAVLTLGPQPGQDNNVVEATFAGNTSFAAAFAASGKVPGAPGQTSISGIVLDNSNNPIPNATMRVFQANQGSSNNQQQQVATPVQTDATGYFKILPAPVGVYKLMADGTTATQGGKLYPTLEYDIVTVAGQDNGVGMPIYLPELDPAAKICVNETTGGVLRLSKSPGFSLTVAPGSASFPGGSKTGCVSVTPVNPDKVPMAPGFGQQPRYIVTIQPVGTTFNPPAGMTIPNVDGLPPNAKTEMYSYDHDLAAFVAIGSATVSADGSLIKSDPGVGVLKAGWHCGGNPNTTGSAGTCPDCQKCIGTSCAAAPGLANAPCKSDGNVCTADVCLQGECQHPPITVEITRVDTPSKSATPPGERSFIEDDSIQAVGRSLVPTAASLNGTFDSLMQWKATSVGPRSGSADPATRSGPTFSFTTRPASPLTTGSTTANPALAFDVVARIGAETASCPATTYSLRQDERDVMRQEYSDFQTVNGDVSIPARSALQSPPIATPSLNGGNYNLIFNGDILLAMLDDFIANLNAILGAQDTLVVPPCTCAPNDQSCFDQHPASCKLTAQTVVVRAGTSTSATRPADTTFNRQVIVFHTRPGGDDTFDTQGNILAGPNGRAETQANTVVLPTFTRASLVVTSGYRNPRRNLAVGSQNPNSFHVQGRALDIANFDIPGLIPVPGVASAANSRCIAELAGDRAVQAQNAFAEQGPTTLACDSASVDHLHMQRP